MTATITAVHVAELRDLPVTARIVSSKLVGWVGLDLRERGAPAAPIRVGSVGGRLYVMNDFEMVAGLRLAGIETAQAVVEVYPNMMELLAGHVECNLRPHSLDPLKLRQMIGYLYTDCGMEVDDACRALGLDARPDLRRSVSAPLTDGARDALLAMSEEIAGRVHHVVTPPYYVAKLAKIAPRAQADAAAEMASHTHPRMMSDETAAWPTPDMVDSMLDGFPRAGRDVPAEERVSVPGEVGDLTKKRTRKDKEEGAKAAKKAADYIGPDSSLVYVPTKGKQPDLIFNTKTGRAAMAKETGGTYTMTDDLGRPTYALGASVTRYLGIDSAGSEGSLVVARYPSIRKAREALAGAKDPGTRCVVMSTCPLPRR